MNILKILTPKRKIGNLGENEAAKFLKKTGYKILERNYVALGSEIDIIAKNKNIIAFIEVKARNILNLGKKEARPASSVNCEKQQKIIRAASYYIAHNPSESRFRFDVIEVYLDDSGRRVKVKEIKHLENTFDKNTAYLYNH